MDGLPIWRAAVECVGGDPDADSLSEETVIAARRALRQVDAAIGREMGEVGIASYTLQHERDIPDHD